MWLLGILGCLERVTGEEIPLDPRFYAAVEEARGSEAQGGGSSVPFSSIKTEKVSVKGIVVSEDDMAVDIDVRVPDPTAPGGMAGKGKILLERPGEFELMVPIDLGSLELQAFQDIDSDGPNATDPFAQVTISVEDQPIDDVQLTLVVGARGAAPVHQEVQPEQSGEMPKGIPENPDPFGGVAGNRIELTGTLACEQTCNGIDLDLFAPDDNSPGGRKMLGKMKLQEGEFVIMVPENFGPLVLEAFVDFGGDGPGVGDLMGVYESNPVVIGTSTVQDIHIDLTQSADGKMPMQPPARPQ
jgi:hypothetical protein